MLIEEGENAGVALRGLFIISPTGVLRQATVNDLPVGRSGGWAGWVGGAVPWQRCAGRPSPDGAATGVSRNPPDAAA